LKRTTLLGTLGAALLSLTLSGCASWSSPHNMQVSFVVACGNYWAAQSGAIQLRQMGKLSPTDISTLNTVMEQITPICTQSPLPSDPVVETQKVSAALTTAVMKAGLAYAQQKQVNK